jgi:hypothetical protein
LVSGPPRTKSDAERRRDRRAKQARRRADAQPNPDLTIELYAVEVSSDDGKTWRFFAEYGDKLTADQASVNVRSHDGSRLLGRRVPYWGHAASVSGVAPTPHARVFASDADVAAVGGAR